MLDIDDEKFAPPNPHRMAMTTNTQYGVAGSCTAKPSQIVGASSEAVDSAGRAGQAGQCHQPEQLVSAEIEADLRQADRHRREQHPDREGQQQRGNRDDQVAGGDPLAGALPVAGVFRRPVADDATRTGGAADNRIATDGHTWLQGCGMTWVLRFKL
ncbi:hypothetical protein G6F68_014247 [Rhizopus microsporus]|nr:hypothetical protein G6F68_014247 [Rhizopus microsporus]